MTVLEGVGTSVDGDVDLLVGWPVLAGLLGHDHVPFVWTTARASRRCCLCPGQTWHLPFSSGGEQHEEAVPSESQRAVGGMPRTPDSAARCDVWGRGRALPGMDPSGGRRSDDAARWSDTRLARPSEGRLWRAVP